MKPNKALTANQKVKQKAQTEVADGIQTLTVINMTELEALSQQ